MRISSLILAVMGIAAQTVYAMALPAAVSDANEAPTLEQRSLYPDRRWIVDSTDDLSVDWYITNDNGNIAPYWIHKDDPELKLRDLSEPSLEKRQFIDWVGTFHNANCVGLKLQYRNPASPGCHQAEPAQFGAASIKLSTRGNNRVSLWGLAWCAGAGVIHLVNYNGCYTHPQRYSAFSVCYNCS